MNILTLGVLLLPALGAGAATPRRATADAVRRIPSALPAPLRFAAGRFLADQGPGYRALRRLASAVSRPAAAPADEAGPADELFERFSRRIESPHSDSLELLGRLGALKEALALGPEGAPRPLEEAELKIGAVMSPERHRRVKLWMRRTAEQLDAWTRAPDEPVGAVPTPRALAIGVLAEGERTAISAPEFHRRFGVIHAPRLLLSRDLPPAFYRDHTGLPEGGRFTDELAAGRTAEVFVSRIDERLGHGLFAARPLKEGDFIGEYTGVLRPWSPLDAERESGNPYLFKYIDDDWAIDALRAGNVTRFINHSALHANVKPIMVVAGGLRRVAFAATRLIMPGSQLLFDYGPNYWLGRGSPDEILP